MSSHSFTTEATPAPVGPLVPVHMNIRLELVPACIEQWYASQIVNAFASANWNGSSLSRK